MKLMFLLKTGIVIFAIGILVFGLINLYISAYNSTQIKWQDFGTVIKSIPVTTGSINNPVFYNLIINMTYHGIIPAGSYIHFVKGDIVVVTLLNNNSIDVEPA